MKKFLPALCLFFACGLQSQEAGQLDSIVSHFDKGGFFKGTVLVAKDGTILLNKGYGLANAVSKQPNDINTIYPIGSVTKQFTAAVIMKLQEQGKLKVTDTISRYFPGLKHGNKITIHHLLTHTSGLFNYTADTAIWYGTLNEKKLIGVLNSKELEFVPGTKMSYCNSGYALLGYLTEKLTGKKYETVVTETIFKPLRMDQSGFDFNRLNSKQKATGYYDNAGSREARLIDVTVANAAGSIYSTTKDLYKWSQAIHEGKLLSAASWAAMKKPFLNNYAYGLVIGDVDGEEALWHNGGLDGFVSNLGIVPSRRIAVIMLSNSMQSDVLKLTETLALAVAGKKYQLPAIRNEITVSAESLADYAGNYELTSAFIITVTNEGATLMAQATGQPKFQVFPEKKDFFFYKVVDAQLEFIRDASGNVTELVLHQNGLKQKAKKIK